MSFKDDFRDTNYSKSSHHPYKGKSYGSSGGPACPTCGGRNSTVLDSRAIPNGQRRRRDCMSGKKCPRWTTYETNFDPATLTPDLSLADKNRILRIIEVADALRASLKIDK